MDYYHNIKSDKLIRLQHSQFSVIKSKFTIKSKKLLINWLNDVNFLLKFNCKNISKLRSLIKKELNVKLSFDYPDILNSDKVTIKLCQDTNNSYKIIILLISLFVYSENNSYAILQPIIQIKSQIFCTQAIKFYRVQTNDGLIINSNLYCNSCSKITKTYALKMSNLRKDNKLLRLYCCMYYKLICNQLLAPYFKQEIIKNIFNYIQIPYFTKYISLLEIPSVSQSELESVLKNIIFINLMQ